MKDEIYSGLKNAVERGSSLEEAMQTFINAGYNPQEVREAGKMLSGGVSDIVFQNQSSQSQAKENNLLTPLPTEDKGQKSKKNKPIIILIIFVSLVLLSAIGFLVYVLLNRGP